MPEPAATARRSATTSQALYHLTKTLDPTRPVIGNDGWESVATDIIGIHDYDADPERIARALPRRRDAAAAVRARAARRAPAGARRAAARGPADHADRVRRHRAAPSDAGDVGLLAAPRRAEEFAARYARLLEAVRSLGAASPASATRSSPTPTRRPTGCCYADRTPKIPARREIARGDRAAPSRAPGRRLDRTRWPGRRPGRRGGAMNKRVLTKPDGRALIAVLARGRSPRRIDAPSPSTAPHAPNAHLRWHPLRGEWVAYADAPAGPHVPAAAGIQPAGADDRSRRIRPRCRRATTTSRCSRTCFRRCTPVAHDPPALIVADRGRRAALRGRGLHPGPARPRSARCRCGTSS